jgi:two-component system response regulator FixJ
MRDFQMPGEKLIYIVDDDHDVRTAIAFMLGTDGVSSRGFSGGRDFLEALPALTPGWVLLDIRMPRVSGLDVLRELARHACVWPVVVMTGHGEQHLAQTALKLGAFAFLEKPFDADVLLGFLRQPVN